MPLVTLNEILRDTRTQKYAVGAFDTQDDYFTEAILAAAEEKGLPVILMILDSFPEIGGRSYCFAKLLDRCRRSDIPVCLHLDHGSSFESVIRAIRSGCSSVMFDGSALPIGENIAITRKIVETAHACGVSVEAEIGHVGRPEGELQASDVDTGTYTRPEDAQYFVRQTGVDALAVAVGTVHGLFRGVPKIDCGLLDQIGAVVDVPLVLHGGSGVSPEEFRKAIAHGICKVNYFTGLSLAASDAIREKLAGVDKIHYFELMRAAYVRLVAEVKEQMSVFGTQPLN